MIDLNKFCGKDGGVCSPFNIDTPFIDNGHKYATNGYAIIRMKSDEPNTDGRLIPKDLNSFFENAFEKIGFNIDHIVDSAASIKCGVCDGTGEDRNACPQCNGTGTCICECYDEHSCGLCDGSGKSGDDAIKCTNCDGSGEIKIWNHVGIHGQKYSEEYLSLCKSDLPGFEIVGMTGDLLKFQFDGGEGVLLKIA